MLKDAEFRKLSQFIYDGYGIKLSDSKKSMLEGRLQKRLHQNQLNSFKRYFDFLTSPKGKMEVIHMVDCVSTNKTDFFREPAHFEFLADEILPQFSKSYGSSKSLTIWSSACSSGEEVYTTAIVMEEFIRNGGATNYSILGTDISYEILKNAINGVYPEKSIEKIPQSIKKEYFLKSKNKELNLVRVIPKLRNKTSFSRLNLMQGCYGEQSKYDIIFCRNVLIYFDRRTQEEVVRKQCYTLKKGGYFFLGHTESINGMDLPLKQIVPTVYQKI